LELTPQYAKQACDNYHAMMSSADNIAYGTGATGFPGTVAAGAAKGGLISGIAGTRSFGVGSLVLAFTSLVAATLEKFSTPPPGFT
jgi:hypothetical protein